MLFAPQSLALSFKRGPEPTESLQLRITVVGSVRMARRAGKRLPDSVRFRSPSSQYRLPSFPVLFVFIVIQHDRRRLVRFNVTAHPTAEWTGRQILEAFPFEAHRGICCAIEIAFMARHFATKSSS
jgi:hypothetical protein